MGNMHTEGEATPRLSPSKAKSEFPGGSEEESAEVPPGGSKDHRPKCGLAHGLGC